MATMFLITRATWSGNDMQDDSREYVETVGLFATRAEAEVVKEEIDGWPRYASGVQQDCQEDSKGNYHTNSWSWFEGTGECTIKELEVGVVRARPLQEEAVLHFETAAAAKRECQRLYDEKQKAEREATKLFESLGAMKHQESLAWYLALAGCRTKEDVLALGANEFVSNKDARYWMTYGHHKNDVLEAAQGLRDFKFQLTGVLPVDKILEVTRQEVIRLTSDDDSDLPF